MTTIVISSESVGASIWAPHRGLSPGLSQEPDVEIGKLLPPETPDTIFTQLMPSYTPWLNKKYAKRLIRLRIMK